MAYTDSEAYIHNQAYVPDTISDAPGAGTDAPGTPDAGRRPTTGASLPSCAHAQSYASPPLRPSFRDLCYATQATQGH